MMNKRLTCLEIIFSIAYVAEIIIAVIIYIKKQRAIQCIKPLYQKRTDIIPLE